MGGSGRAALVRVTLTNFMRSTFALLFSAIAAIVCMGAESAEPWWKHALIYEICPRSFQDSDGSGIGNLKRAIDPRYGTMADLC